MDVIERRSVTSIDRCVDQRYKNTECVRYLNKLNLVKLGNGGLVVGFSQSASKMTLASKMTQKLSSCFVRLSEIFLMRTICKLFGIILMNRGEKTKCRHNPLEILKYLKLFG